MAAYLPRAARTAPGYTLQPPKPGLVCTGDPNNHAIGVEVWAVPMVIGIITLDDGARVRGFVCKSTRGAVRRGISRFGGRRNDLASKRS